MTFLKHLQLALIAALGMAAPLYAAEEITMVADNWCPFNCDPTDENPGFFIEAAKLIFEPKGYKINYQIVPWTRAIEEVMAGKYNILIAASLEETPDILFPKALDVSCGFNVFVRDDNPFIWRGVESIKDLRIGGVQDYVYSEAINAYIDENKSKAGHKIQIMHGDTALPTNIKKLLGKRIDVLFENAAVLNHQFSQMGAELEGLGLSGMPKNIGMADTADTTCYLGFSPKRENSPQLIKILEEGVQRLEADGTMTKLRAKYGM